MKKLLLVLFFAVTSHADTLKIIVPYAPGGNTDLTARLIAKELANQNIDAVIVNRPGAEGLVGQNDMLTQRPDGNTVLFTGSGGIIYNSLASVANYEKMRQLVPVSRMTITGQLLVTKRDNPIKTWEQLQSAARTRTVTIGTNSGIMRSMIQELFPNNPNVIIVPYNSDTQAMTGLLSSTVEVATVTFVFETNIANGELNGLAVTTDTGRFGIRSLRELGTGVSREQWYGFFLPPNTPTVTRNRLALAFNTAKQSPELDRAIRTSIHATLSKTVTPNEFAHAIEAEYQKLLPTYNK
jgi:tripartite-type tricarboxylate transporter receptor subunit TctC